VATSKERQQALHRVQLQGLPGSLTEQPDGRDARLENTSCSHHSWVTIRMKTQKHKLTSGISM